MADIISQEYKDWLIEIKTKIQSTQIKAAIAVNAALIEFYWDLGKLISQKQTQNKCGDKLLARLSNVLVAEVSSIRGLSRIYLDYCQHVYLSYGSSQIGQQPVDQNQNGINKSRGISKFQLTKLLRDYLESSLPTIEEIESELGGK